MVIYLKNSPEIKGIEILGKEFIISQFADDTALFLRNNMVSKVINKIGFFSKASGLTLNLRKCELLVVHGSNLNSIANIPVKNKVKYLGLVITKNVHDGEDLNITPRVKTVQKVLNHWLTQDLSKLGRILLSKVDDLSRLIYACHSLHTPPKMIKSANSVIFKFICKNKTHHLPKSQLVRDYTNGGLKAMEFESVIASFRIKWLKDCMSQPHSILYHIPNKIFNKVGGIDFLLKCDFL